MLGRLQFIFYVLKVTERMKYLSQVRVAYGGTSIGRLCPSFLREEKEEKATIILLLRALFLSSSSRDSGFLSHQPLTLCYLVL
jgi:hypothetical protein